ncbi:hypothetical protein BD779DRAFT_1667693 [Infundibulicybe gibba]|nr:hypothetical protein BD779DRAFT_1667693 [Infundibulicybe gibba]
MSSSSRRMLAQSNIKCTIMDLVLEILDEYVLDKVWAKLIPLSAFTHLPKVVADDRILATSQYVRVVLLTSPDNRTIRMAKGQNPTMDESDIEDSVGSVSPQYSPSYQQSFGSESSSSRYSTPSFPNSRLPATGTSNYSAPSSRATTPFIPPYHIRDRTPVNSHHDYSPPNPFDEWQDYPEVRAPELPQGSTGRFHQPWVPPQSPSYAPLMAARHDHQGRPAMHDMPAPSENMYFKKRYLDLLVAYRSLESEMKGFTCAHDALVRSITSTGTSTLGGYPHSGPSYKVPVQSPLLLDQADYPNVQYWHAKSFKATTQDAGTVFGESVGKGGRVRRASGVNVAYLFVEDRNGIPATGEILDRITAHARRVFSELLKSNAAPQKWSQGTPHAQNYFRAEMHHEFPDLRLCENNWKADKIATQLYPGWFGARKNHNASEAIKRTSTTPTRPTVHPEIIRPAVHPETICQTPAKPPAKPSARPANLKHYLPSDMHEGSRKKPYKVPGTLQHSIHPSPDEVFPNPVLGEATELFAGSHAGTTALIDTDGDLEMLLPGIKILGSETPAIPIIHAPAPALQVTGPPTRHLAPIIPPTLTPPINMGEGGGMEDSPQLESRSPAALATESSLDPDYDEPSQFASTHSNVSDIGFRQPENSQSSFADQGISQTGNSPPQVISPMITFTSAHLRATDSAPTRSPETMTASTPMHPPATATTSAPVRSPKTATASTPARSPMTTFIIPKLIHPLLGFGNSGQNPIQTTSRLTAKATDAITRTLGGTESQVATLTNSHFSLGASTSSADATVVGLQKGYKDILPLFNFNFCTVRTVVYSVARTSNHPPTRGLFDIDYRNKNGTAPVSAFRAAWNTADEATKTCYTERSSLLRKKAKASKGKAAGGPGDGSALP